MAKKEKSKQKTKKKKESKIPSPSMDAHDLQRQLSGIGLVEKEILGDGNCLFRSIADQYFGNPQLYKEMREIICKHIADYEELYKDFITDDETFEHYIQRMKRDRSHGGNMELVAASRHFQRNVFVHQLRQPVWRIGDIENDQPSLHIIYYSWEHYSSARNTDGPHSGLPNINIQVAEQECHVPESGTKKEQIELTDFEKIVMQSVNLEKKDLPQVRRLLEKHRGNPSAVVDELFEKQSQSNDEWIPEHIKNNISMQKKERIIENRGKRKKKKDIKSENINETISMIAAISI